MMYLLAGIAGYSAYHNPAASATKIIQKLDKKLPRKPVLSRAIFTSHFLLTAKWGKFFRKPVDI